MSPGKLLQWWTLIWLMMGALACGSEPGSFALNIDLRTDFNPVIEFDSVSVELDNRLIGTRAMQLSDDVSTGVRILDGMAPEGRHLVTVRLFLGAGQLAERSFQLDVTSDVSLIAVITRSCAGLVCGTGQTCIDEGRCGSILCVTGMEAECVGTCSSDLDCGATQCCSAFGCAQERCQLGVCVAPLDTPICQSWEYCAAETGCRTRPGETPPLMDAGMPDAGPPDTGPPDIGPPDMGPPPPPPPDPPTDDHLGNPQWASVPVRFRGQCSNVSACGEDPQGIWDVSNGCLELSMSPSDVPQCTISSNLTGRARGRARVGETRMQQTLEWEISGSVTANCGAVPCNLARAELQRQLRMHIPGTTCNNSCRCTGSDGDTVNDNGAYTNSGGRVSVGSRNYRVCPSGNRMNIQRTDESSTFVVSRQPLE